MTGVRRPMKYLHAKMPISAPGGFQERSPQRGTFIDMGCTVSQS